MALYSETKPHGGKLVNRLISAEEAASWVARAVELPQLQLDFRQWSDLYLIAEGAFSPIEGFQGSDEVRSVARDFQLRSGLIWSIPILLLAGDEAKQWKEGAAVLLLDPQSAPAGGLPLGEEFPVAQSELAEQVFRTSDEKHPGVAWLYGAGDTALAGTV